jgi:hypothetical protein
MKSIKVSDYINLVKPEYVYLKLTPNNAIRNNGTHKIAKAIASLYKSVIQNVKADEQRLVNVLGKRLIIGTKYTYKQPSKVSYYVYINKKQVDFFLIIPKQYESIIREKVSDVWTNITVKKVNAIPGFRDDATKYQLAYKREDALSLEADRRDNDLLRSNLNVIDVLEEGEQVGIFYNFVPTSQYGWRSKYEATIRKVKDNRPTDRNKVGINFIAVTLISFISSLANDISEVLAGKKSGADSTGIIERALDRLNGRKGISDCTDKKGRDDVIDTQILVLSESTDKLREVNNGRSLAQSFRAVDGDNSLTYKRYTKPFKPLSLRLEGAENNKVSTLEASNFLSLAGRELLEQYHFIEKVETHETQVPEDLRSGVMRIGMNRYRGNEQMAYMTTHREYQYLLSLLIGPTRSGKSTLIGNLTYDAIKAGECVVIFDFIENCELSSEVAALIPQDKVLNIVCDNPALAQGLGYNEVKMSNDPFTQYTNAKVQSTQILDLINAINMDNKQLAPKMERYLESAANIVFLSGGSVRDVFAVLQNHEKRAEFIRKVPKVQYEYLGEYIENLQELDDYDSKTKELVGTRLHLITGIIDRLNKLKRNPYMELMLKKGTEGNVDLVEEMQKNQLICIKMPEDMFNTDNERDICTTYWITKLWLAAQIRASQIRDKDQRKKVNLIIDELYQVENTERFLTDKLSRLAKFRLKPIVSCHYISQLKHMKSELRGANASYMLIAGCDESNFNELKNDLYPFTPDDLLNLPEHHSMNYVKTKDGYARFITKLPKPVGINIEETRKASAL